MTALLLAPAALSFLVLGAHFLRAGQLALVVLAVGLLALLFVRRRWAGLTVQVALLLGAVEWVRTTRDLTGERASMGRPYGRMVIILGAVAAVCALSALLLIAPRARRSFGERRPEEPAP
ncbi:MAG: hypothetical protein ABSB58_04075 [Gemmatimonadales bacterium]